MSSDRSDQPAAFELDMQPYLNDRDDVTGPWPLGWQGLSPGERQIWFERVWSDVCDLRERYWLSVRSGWWENQVQLEALAALAAWVRRYDSGEWDDPPGKLDLLFTLERIAGLLREGGQPFDPVRDHHAFTRYLADLGCLSDIEFPQAAQPRYQEE